MILTTEWVDASSNVLPIATPDARARLSIHVPPGTNQFLIQRRSSSEQAWTNPALNGKRGWQPIQTDTGSVQFIDATAKPDLVWSYRIQIRMADNRTSDPVSVQFANLN